jgi:predicted permease
VTVLGILAEAGRLYVRFFWRGLLIAVPLFVVLPIPAAILDVQHDTTWTILVASLFVTMFTSYGDFLVEGALTLDIRHREEVGAYPRLRELIHQARPHLFTLLAATLIYSICIGVGLALLVVPGLFVLVRWSVIVPVIVVEGRGMRESFSRSNALVRGHSWTVLWTLGIILVVSAFVETGFDNLLYPLPEFFASWLGHFLVSVITAPYAAHALAIIYFRLAAVDFGPARSS